MGKYIDNEMEKSVSSDMFAPAKKEDEPSDEDMFLLERGIPIDLANSYKKRPTARNIIWRGNLNGDFFNWLLDTVTPKQLELIRERTDKFTESQQKALEKTEAITETPLTPKEGSIADYINKNQELLREKAELMERILDLENNNFELKEENKILEGYKRDLQNEADIHKFGLLNGLYDLMNNKMSFVKEVTAKEMDMLKEVEEVLEK